jgi:membrane fusion protein (multidrug efflux system)
VTLTLEDGSTYPVTGRLEFSDVTVDPTTGSVGLRATFDNPNGVLLPGMYVRAVLGKGVAGDGMLIPQAAVSRDPKGNATVWVVGPGNRAVERTVVAERTQGTDWVVTQGLAAGEKVITQGTANLRDGAQLKPVPASAPQRLKPAPAKKG